MKIFYCATIISLLALTIMGCSTPDISNSQASPINSPSAKPIVNKRKVKLDARLVEASTKFGFNVFDRLAQKDTNKNRLNR